MTSSSFSFLSAGLFVVGPNLTPFISEGGIEHFLVRAIPNKDRDFPAVRARDYFRGR